MSSSTPHDPSPLQARAQEIKDRVAADPEFRQQVEADPVGVLVSAGLPEDAIVVADPKAETDDVSGFRMDEEPGTCLLWGIDECWIWVKW